MDLVQAGKSWSCQHVQYRHWESYVQGLNRLGLYVPDKEKVGFEVEGKRGAKYGNCSWCELGGDSHLLWKSATQDKKIQALSIWIRLSPCAYGLRQMLKC